MSKREYSKRQGEEEEDQADSQTTGEFARFVSRRGALLVGRSSVITRTDVRNVVLSSERSQQATGSTTTVRYPRNIPLVLRVPQKLQLIEDTTQRQYMIQIWMRQKTVAEQSKEEQMSKKVYH
jgi:hypothetical protein